MNDAEAVQLCQDGSLDAFRHLVERYQDVLYGTAYLMTSNGAIAEECVQESFLSAWRGIGGFRSGSPIKPWLVRYPGQHGIGPAQAAQPAHGLRRERRFSIGRG